MTADHGSSIAIPTPPPAVDADTVRAWCALVTDAVRGEQDGRWRRTATGELGEKPGHPRAAAQLRGWIYRDVHLGGEPVADPSPENDAAALSLLTELATGTWPDPGWRVEGTSGSDTLVTKRGIRLSVEAADLTRGTDGTAVLRLPRARPGALFGWFGYTGPAGPPDRPRARIYLHLPSLTDRSALGAALDALEGLDVPWQAKTAIRGDTARPRPDSFVIYLNGADAVPAARALCSSGLPDVLRDPVPGFSTRMAQGMGLAVHPPGLAGGSFGARIADLFARSLIAQGTADLAERIATALNRPGGGDGR